MEGVGRACRTLNCLKIERDGRPLASSSSCHSGVTPPHRRWMMTWVNYFHQALSCASRCASGTVIHNDIVVLPEYVGGTSTFSGKKPPTSQKGSEREFFTHSRILFYNAAKTTTPISQQFCAHSTTGPSQNMVSASAPRPRGGANGRIRVHFIMFFIQNVKPIISFPLRLSFRDPKHYGPFPRLYSLGQD